MKVKTLLDRILLSSAFDFVRICRYGEVIAVLSKKDVQNREYGVLADNKVETFSFHDSMMILNLR